MDACLISCDNNHRKSGQGIMKSLFHKFAMPGLILAWFFSPANANAACATSAASLHGGYGMLVTGTTLNASSAANFGGKFLAGAVQFDGVGNVSGTHVYSDYGVVSAVTGTYAVNTDCTLTISMTIGSGAAQVYTVAIKTSNEAVGIEVDNSAVATIDLQAQYTASTAATSFTNGSANGLFTGACYGAAGYAAASNGAASVQTDLNIATFSNGTLSGTNPNQGPIGSIALANVPYTGNYTVNSDGTFSGTAFEGAEKYDFYGVIANGGTELLYFYTSGAPAPAVESCVLKL